MLNSLRDELHYLLFGEGMPYQKVALMVAVVCSVLFTLTLGNNVIKEAPVAVIDLDNSKYSHELTEQINASPFMRVAAVLNTPMDPKTLFYNDKYIAAVVLPQDLEKNRYSNSAASVGVIYDNANTAQTAYIRQYLNTLIAEESMSIVGATEDGPGLTLKERNVFNPSDSAANGGEVQGFLFFFSSMFFTFATIGMIPRLRAMGKLQEAAAAGEPGRLLVRLLPYCACLLTATFVGLAILRILNDMVFSGSILLFLLTQCLYVPILGIISLIFGWTAVNPGVANSRMILFIPGGFIFGGSTGPLPIQSGWMQLLGHIFPLRWEYEFIRDIIIRGAGFTDISSELGGFLIYGALVLALFYRYYFRIPLPAVSAAENTAAIKS